MGKKEKRLYHTYIRSVFDEDYVLRVYISYLFRIAKFLGVNIFDEDLEIKIPIGYSTVTEVQ